MSGRKARRIMRWWVGGDVPPMAGDNCMSNENQSGNANERGGSVSNDPTRTAGATGPKSGQQSQGEAHPTEKSATQQGGSDTKSAQQSQGGTQKDASGTKQGGSANVATDPKKTGEAAQKAGSTK
jgi:hypothetical protein